MQKTLIITLSISIAAAAACAHGVSRLVVAIVYDRDVDAHLKLAADSNSMELAEQQLSIAIDNLEDRGTMRYAEQDCFTSVLYDTPDEDVCFWLTNLNGARDSLLAMQESGPVDDLTESNQLIKIRETLLDHSQSGDSVTSPSGIHLYPNNAAWAAWGWLAWLAAIGLGVTVYVRAMMD